MQFPTKYSYPQFLLDNNEIELKLKRDISCLTAPETKDLCNQSHVSFEILTKTHTVLRSVIKLHQACWNIYKQIRLKLRKINSALIIYNTC